MLLAYTGKCPQADPAKRTTDKTSSAVTTQFVLKLWLLRRDIIKIETGICVAFLLQVRNIIFVSLMFTVYIYNHNIMIKKIYNKNQHIHIIYIQFQKNLVCFCKI